MTNSEKMLACLNEQDLVKADKYFKRALAQDTDDTVLDLAVYLEGVGFFHQAKIIYQKLVSRYPELAIRLAQISIEDGLLEEAMAYLDEIEEHHPAYLEALLVKADLYQSEGLADVAREKLLEAARLSDDPIVLFGLAEIDMELELFQEAIATYAKLDNREMYDLTGISTYQRIGLAYASLGKFEVAVEFLEKSVELAYDDQTIFELATLLLEQQEYQKATFYFKQLDILNPDFEGYEYLYAQALHAEYRLDEALAVLQKGLSKNDFDEALWLLASQYAYENHDVHTAEDYLLKAKALADDVNEVVLRLSNLYLEQERFEEVLDLFDEELDNVLVRWNMAKACQALEKYEDALELFKSLEADLADNPEFLRDYIDILREIGRLKDAKIIVKHYLEFIPDDVEMQEFYRYNE